MYAPALTHNVDAYASHNITISPDGELAPVEPDGDVNLYGQASLIFSQLHQPNTFTGETNTFRTVVVQRLQTTSDMTLKTDIVPMDGATATGHVRNIQMYHYRLDGVPTAGVMAQELPEAYTMRHPSTGHLTVDYQSLLAELWSSVRHAHDRLDALAAHQEVHVAGEVLRCADHGHAQDEVDVEPVDDAVTGRNAQEFPEGIV
jgi:hypothetical protein